MQCSSAILHTQRSTLFQTVGVACRKHIRSHTVRFWLQTVVLVQQWSGQHSRCSSSPPEPQNRAKLGCSQRCRILPPSAGDVRRSWRARLYLLCRTERARKFRALSSTPSGGVSHRPAAAAVSRCARGELATERAVGAPWSEHLYLLRHQRATSGKQRGHSVQRGG